ncbi:MAG: hypothetical protein WCA77_00575 [Thermoplasmata archaeon]
MRPGLVGLGAIFLALAAVTVAALFFPAGAPTSSTSGAFQPVSIEAHAQAAVELPVSNTSDGVLTIDWNSTVPLNVVLDNPVHCSLSNRTCVNLSVVIQWTGSLGGQFRVTGNIRAPFLLVLNNSGSQSGSYLWTLTEGTVSQLPLLTLILVIALAIVVGGSGGIALFLGLFLRSGVYDGPQPIVSHSADDVDEIARGERDPESDLNTL